MLTIGGYDFESLPTMSNNPTFGYEDEYREYKMLSGKIRHDVKGKRFIGKFGFAYLTDTQVGYIYAILDAQKTTGYTTVAITMPDGTFEGNVFLSVSDAQTRFYIVDGVGRWVNWQIELRGIELV